MSRCAAICRSMFHEARLQRDSLWIHRQVARCDSRWRSCICSRSVEARCSRLASVGSSFDLTTVLPAAAESARACSFAFCLGDTLVRSAQGCAEVARLREDLVFVTFQRDDVVSQPKRLHLAPLGRHTSLQLPHFFIGLRERLCRRGAVCLREVDAVRFDDRVKHRREHFAMRARGNQLDDVRVWNRHRLHVRLHVGNPIRTNAEIRLPYTIQPRRSQFQDRAAGQHLRFGKKRPWRRRAWTLQQVPRGGPPPPA